jgi:hypothetical protein
MAFPDLRRLAAKFPKPRELAWAVGGACAVGIVSVSAQQYQAANTEAPPCPISDSIQQAVNSKIQLIGVTGTDVSKYFAVGSASSCIDSLLNTSFDLSKLIPDPVGWITEAAQYAIKAASEAAVGKVCTAARNAMGDVIGKYNNAVGVVTGFKTQIDTTIAGQSVASYGTNYGGQVTVKGVLDGIPANTMPNSPPAGTSGTTISGGGTTITAPANTPVTPTSPTAYSSTPAASPAPMTSYQTAPQYQQQPQQAQPVTPATVGTSVFGR